MARRKVTHRAKCGFDGCTESGWYEFSSQREYREHIERQGGKPWLCTRHWRPDEVLSADIPKRTTTYVSTELKSDITGNSLGLYWVAEGARSGSGFTHGPGFKAYTSDFPEGTRLTVTATVEIPRGES